LFSTSGHKSRLASRVALAGCTQHANRLLCNHRKDCVLSVTLVRKSRLHKNRLHVFCIHSPWMLTSTTPPPRAEPSRAQHPLPTHQHLHWLKPTLGKPTFTQPRSQPSPGERTPAGAPRPRYSGSLAPSGSRGTAGKPGPPCPWPWPTQLVGDEAKRSEAKSVEPRRSADA
jgi:hypothetical protein